MLSACSIAGHEAMLRDENSLMPLQLATIQSDTQTGHAYLEAGAFLCRLCNSEARAANHWIVSQLQGRGHARRPKQRQRPAVIRVPDRVRSAHPNASRVSHTQDRNCHGATRAAFVPVCILFVQASVLPPQLARGDMHSAALRAASQLRAQSRQMNLSIYIPLRGGEAVPSDGLF
jgi:hypothetical protein